MVNTKFAALTAALIHMAVRLLANPAIRRIVAL